MIKETKNNRGFVILFAITLSSILLAIALGVANITLEELKFGTSAQNTNNAFFAADTGTEYALFNDKPSVNNYPSPATDGAQQTWFVIISGLGGAGASCAVVSITKTNVLNSPDITTTIISKGYNAGGSAPGSCNPPPNSVEREIKTNY